MENKEKISIFKLRKEIDISEAKTEGDVVRILKEIFKYVQFLELCHSMRFVNEIWKFKRIILCSDILEHYEEDTMEIDNIQITLKKANVSLGRVGEIKMKKKKKIEIIPIVETI